MVLEKKKVFFENNHHNSCLIVINAEENFKKKENIKIKLILLLGIFLIKFVVKKTLLE